jgi:hypothetical protein
MTSNKSHNNINNTYTNWIINKSKKQIENYEQYFLFIT